MTYTTDDLDALAQPDHGHGWPDRVVSGCPVCYPAPWTDADTAALADAMADAAHDRRQRYSGLRHGAEAWRRGAVVMHTAHAGWSAIAQTLLAADAARVGLATPPTFPDAWARYRELVDVAMHTATARDEAAYAPSGARYYEDSDGFDERTLTRNANGTASQRFRLPPIYRAGLTA